MYTSRCINKKLLKDKKKSKKINKITITKFIRKVLDKIRTAGEDRRFKKKIK